MIYFFELLWQGLLINFSLRKSKFLFKNAFKQNKRAMSFLNDKFCVLSISLQKFKKFNEFRYNQIIYISKPKNSCGEIFLLVQRENWFSTQQQFISLIISNITTNISSANTFLKKHFAIIYIILLFSNTHLGFFLSMTSFLFEIHSLL